jgi:hypothetical protein
MGCNSTWHLTREQRNSQCFRTASFQSSPCSWKISSEPRFSTMWPPQSHNNFAIQRCQTCQTGQSSCVSPCFQSGPRFSQITNHIPVPGHLQDQSSISQQESHIRPPRAKMAIFSVVPETANYTWHSRGREQDPSVQSSPQHMRWAEHRVDCTESCENCLLQTSISSASNPQNGQNPLWGNISFPRPKIPGFQSDRTFFRPGLSHAP